jgi:heavy metal efflux system protein
VDPARAQSYGLTLRDIFERVRENNENFGGGFIEHSAEQYTVRGLGRANSDGDMEEIVLASKHGARRFGAGCRARDHLGAMQRQGAVLRDAKGETVSGMVIMLKGENGKLVIERVKAKLDSMSLPPGLKVLPFYDQSSVIDSTIATVRGTCWKAAGW